MARVKRVQFLRYFNDFRMLAMFTIDVVAIAIGTFLVYYMVTTIGGSPLYMTAIGGIMISGTTVFLYKKARENSARGFLTHWLFSNGFVRLEQNKEKWKELEYADIDDYFPDGKDNYFAD